MASTAPLPRMPDSGLQEEALNVNLGAWRISSPNGLEGIRTRRRQVGELAFATLRTTALLVIVTIAILVLLPALIAAQPTFLG